MMGRFDDKVAVVTGSTQGLGEAIARRFADEGAAGIVVTGRNHDRGTAVANALRGSRCRAIFVPAELAHPDAPAEVIGATDREFGRLDVLVNAAALTLRGTILDTDVELWDTIMDVNLRAPFFLIQGAAQIMRREAIEGSIVNIGSVSGYGSVPNLSPYAISKGALMTMTRNVAYALVRDRIRVNTLNLGWMDTPAEDSIQRQFHGAADDWLERAEASMPFGRLLKPPEVAQAVAFLASDDSGMMTGALIDFDQSVTGGGDQPIPSPDQIPW
jgi:NAD(P)-dependent dehydrogenase (short-subunit alcohol dehydrogenase family)